MNEKGATELIKDQEKTSKLEKIAIYVGKEYGKNANAIKFVIKHLKDQA